MGRAIQGKRSVLMPGWHGGWLSSEARPAPAPELRELGGYPTLGSGACRFAVPAGARRRIPNRSSGNLKYPPNLALTTPDAQLSPICSFLFTLCLSVAHLSHRWHEASWPGMCWAPRASADAARASHCRGVAGRSTAVPLAAPAGSRLSDGPCVLPGPMIVTRGLQQAEGRRHILHQLGCEVQKP
jgi:hypothetical protein